MSKYHKKPITYVDYLSVNVMDLKRSVTFYEKVLGFQVLTREKNRVVLTADGKRPLLILEHPEEVMPKGKRTTGLYHFALLVPERNQLANFLQFLKEHRLTYGASDHILTEALYINDPDGNGIEMYYDKKKEDFPGNVDSLEMATLPLDEENLLREQDGEWQHLPDGTIIGHIHLHVNDLKEAEEFYVDTLGFSIVAQYPGALFISDGGYHHHLGLNVWQGEGAETPPENSVGLNWYTIVLKDKEKREEVVKRLSANEYFIQQDGEDFLTRDPAGNYIYLFV